MDIKDRLNELSKTVDLKHASDISDLDTYFDIYDDVFEHYGQLTQTYTPQLLESLISILKFLTPGAQAIVQHKDEHASKLLSVLNNLSASFLEPNTGNQLFVRFLWSLHNSTELYEKPKFLQGYEKYLDLLESLAWLFQLEIDGTLVYPITDLLNDKILDDFDPDNQESLLYLIASLQLFNKLNNLPPDIRQTVLNLSKQYNLAIVEMLCNHGELLFGDLRKIHMEKNKIMAVRLNNTILIRTTDLSRKAPPGYTYSEEQNKHEIPIARFFTYEIETGCDTCSLDQFLQEAAPEECLKVILDCLENRAYNVFMDDSVVYNRNTRTFVRWINPDVSSDKAIVYKKQSGVTGIGTGESQFFAILDQDKDYSFRPTILVQNGIDMLTLDYIIGFYNAVIKPMNISVVSFLPEAIRQWKAAQDQRNTVFAQNLICESFFAYVRNSKYSISNALTNYDSFTKEHYSSGNEISKNTRLIFPYAFYLPFGNSEELLAAVLESRGVKVSQGKSVRAAYKKKSNTWVIDDKPIEYEFLDSVNFEPISPGSFSTECPALVDKDKKKVYVLNSSAERTVLSAFSKLVGRLDDLVITQDNRGNYDNFHKIKDLKEIIYNIGIPSDITKFFWPESVYHKLTSNELEPLLHFKILHHINQYYITEDKLGAWQDLIFKHHLLDACQSTHHMYRDFASGINSLEAKDGYLLISKQSYADKSTLGAILHDPKPRHWADYAFDSGALNTLIEKNTQTDTGQEIYCLAPQKDQRHQIKCIVFITDNIMSGSSTLQMLQYHFSGQQNAPLSKKKTYITLDPDKSILSIMGKNAPRIELHTAFWFTTLGGCTIHAKEGGFYPVDIPTSADNRVRIYVKACQTYSPSDYLYSEKAFTYAKDIYGELHISARKENGESRHLVFRFNNMPAFSVFPDAVLDIKMKSGLFHRRGIDSQKLPGQSSAT